MPAFSQRLQQLPAAVAVGSSSNGSVTITFSTTGVVRTFTALSGGSTNGDFALTSGGTCVTSHQYSAGAQCAVAVRFAPSYPGVRSGAVLAKDSGGNLLAIGLVSGLATGGLPMLLPGTANTFVGQGDWTYAG
ncbi:MAG: hypothetical protein ACRYHB_11350, partial [Janthinobacterium lividum]